MEKIKYPCIHCGEPQGSKKKCLNNRNFHSFGRFVPPPDSDWWKDKTKEEFDKTFEGKRYIKPV